MDRHDRMEECAPNFAPSTVSEALRLAIVSRAPAELTAYKRNARKHSRRQIQQIAASIRQFGFVNPVLIDAEAQIIAGHGRVEAAKQLGLTSIPTIQIDHMTEAQRRAYIIADNRLAELAGWDRDLLALEFGELLNLELDFEIEVTGFATAEIDTLIDGPVPPKPDKADEIPDLPPDYKPVSQVGDLWLLGPHRLLCGNALESESYAQLLRDEKADMVFSDPPYNVAVAGHVCGSGSIKHREFAMASGEMSSAQFTDFLITALTALARHSQNGALHFICMDWRHIKELLQAGEKAYSELKNLIVWNKDNAGMGTFYRSKHELIFVFKNGNAPHINNFGLGETGRYRTNVWDYAGVNSLRPGRMEELAMHPTVKPVSLVSDAIRDCSRRNGIILDAFGGSGTTLIAAHKTGRKGRLIELDPIYVDVIIKRWSKVTGQTAILESSGQGFSEVATSRFN
ncbi:site-specific DNA-methyltransferase [Ferrovibrio sp.]|uniref:site-specific DNA-methyltransferase n=1 Tax=Ferrovibrio sp. TaxID=1917215 RepID=UPI003D2A22BD